MSKIKPARLQFSPEGVKDARHWWRRAERRLLLATEDLQVLITRFGDLLETLPEKRRGEAARRESRSPKEGKGRLCL